MLVAELQKPMKKILLLATLFFAVVFVMQLLAAPKAHAAYEGGRLIDNSVFLDAQSMSAANIQDFLASKGAGLANMTFTVDCVAAGAQATQIYQSLGAPCGQPASAASIIYWAAQVYGVSPKVILATMQKEQSLTTAANPTSWQLERAMGYGCPTSGGCQGASTFFYQIDNGTWVLRFHYERARGNMNWWYTSTSWTCGTGKPSYYMPNLYPGQNVNFIDPYSGLQYATIHIQNAATSAFYCYTPHTFNNHTNSPHPDELKGASRCYPSLPAAGSQGRCYTGSFNFVKFYELWFGSTQNPDYSWAWQTQATYTDQTKQTSINSNVTPLLPGERYFVSIKVVNTGNVTWNNSDTRLGITHPQTSLLRDSSWPAATRPAILQEATVAPGEVGTFDFWITTPTSQGTYLQYVGIVREGVVWMQNNQGVHIRVAVPSASFSWAWQGQAIYTDNSKVTLAPNPITTLYLPNHRYYAVLSIKNTGNTVWHQSNVRLATFNPADSVGIIHDSTWPTVNRLAVLKEASVAPGQTGSFEFWFTTPSYGGTYLQYLGVVSEGRAWMQNNQGVHIRVAVPSASFSWTWQGQTVYTNDTKSTVVNPFAQNLTSGQRYFAAIQVKNTGNTVWTPANVRLGTSNPADRAGLLHDSTWPTVNRLAVLKDASVAPGQTGSFEFWFTAPSGTGTFREYVNLVKEGVAWMQNNQGVHLYVTIP